MPATKLLDLPEREGLIVALDTETSGLFVDDGARVSVVSIAWRDEAGELESRVYPFDHGLLDKGVPGFQAEIWEQDINLGPDEWDELVAWLQLQRLIFHNAKFDLHIMAAGHRKWGHGVDLSDRVLYDTQVTGLLFFPNQPTGLKPTMARLYGDEERETERALQRWLNKHKVDGNPRYDLAPWELVEPYADGDATKTIRLREHHMRMIDTGECQEPWRLIDQEVDLAICLFRVEQRGMGYDVERCNAAAAKLRKAASDLRIQLRRAWRRDPTPAAASHWFFTQQGEKPINVSEKTGNPSVDMESVQVLVDRRVKWAAEYQQLAQYRSALEKWYEAWPKLVGADGRLRTSFRQTKTEGQQGHGGGAISGRLSVERVQLHAIPHDFRLPSDVDSIRSMFIAKPGHELWEVDISQAEVRVATHMARCEGMLQVLQSGDDVHGQTAMRVFGVTPDDPDWSTKRTVAKRSTFGTIYGFSAQTYRATLRQEGVDVPLTQCEEWLAEYRATFPEFQRLYFSAMQDAKRRGWVMLGSGRRRWFSDFEKQFKASKAFNQIVQGSVAEAMKRIKVEVEVNYPGILVNEIHDSLIVEVPATQEGEAEARVKLVGDLMLTVLEDQHGGWDADHRIPWKVDAKRWAS